MLKAYKAMPVLHTIWILHSKMDADVQAEEDDRGQHVHAACLQARPV